MNVTYAQLLAADLDLWTRGAAAWRRLSHRIDDHADEVSAQVTRLGQVWTGGIAAPAAEAACRTIGTGLAAVPGVLLEVDQLLCRHAELVRALQQRVRVLLASLRGTPVRVSPEGEVSLDVVTVKPDPGEVAFAKWVAAQLAEILRRVRASDEETARRLIALAVGARDGWATSPAPPPPSGILPVATWWAGLAPAQRNWLLVTQPDLVGGLDGVPVAARDRANRLRLDAELDRLRAVLAAPHPPEGTDTRVRTLEDLTTRLERQDPRAYLLNLDVRGDGRAVVAIGDPDVADHVATYVPGSGATIDSAESELNRAAALQLRATVTAPEQSTSTIMWLGYDPPDGVDALLEKSARTAAPDLATFQDGLVGTHEGGPAHRTVIGHSYGSLALGLADRDGTLAADEIVALGSPGMGVDSAAELRDPAHVWAATARNDVILAASSKGEVALDAVGGPALIALGAVTDAVVRGNADLWHGVDPSSAQFGARVFDAGVGRDPLAAHSGYFDKASPALETMAHIVTGTGTTPP
ncbi:alpha/beta hydrolase [Catellatospora sp. KI3]|uniref:alpha/beta hydrolase n=1 Tax=Catellatospora sp. KI3 TaxID=3041620 RepID=UPI0024824612|nr:alpha/beta hydrolase [Catellatospora sp. KI3]MDI1460297.1 alpha/beta hydrolase [Catellatospora sp. KI3]